MTIKMKSISARKHICIQRGSTEISKKPRLELRRKARRIRYQFLPGPPAVDVAQQPQ
jgi:hypothetical protein